MEQFTLEAQRGQLDARGVRYHEFLRVPDLRCGIYRLRAGEADPQKPHAEDEAYFVIEGRATFRTEREEVAVKAGSILYVPRGQDHRFVDIAEDLLVLVFFASPPGGRPQS